MHRLSRAVVRFAWFALCVIAGLWIAAQSEAQTAPPADFVTARNQREQSRATRDAAAFERLTTDGFFIIDQAGAMGDKQERLGRMARAGGPGARGGRGGGDGPFVAAQRLNERIVTYNNDTVVLYYRQNAPGGTQDVTETWVRENGQWKCAAAHVSEPRP